MTLADILSALKRWSERVASAAAGVSDSIHEAEISHPLVQAAVTGIEKELPGLTAAVQGVDQAVLDGAKAIASDAAAELAKHAPPSPTAEPPAPGP